MTYRAAHTAHCQDETYRDAQGMHICEPPSEPDPPSEPVPLERLQESNPARWGSPTPMQTTFDRNIDALALAHTAADRWATILDPADVCRDIDQHLLGQLMAITDPATFAQLLAQAEDFAGKPDAF